MLNDNLRKLRKSKGMSQDELAIQLNVVRQTISKWEHGSSVPDSEMLLRIADALDTSVNILLGDETESNSKAEVKMITDKLEILNEQFAKRTEKQRKIWRAVFIIIGIIAAIYLVQALIGYIHTQVISNSMNSNTSIIGGSDAPTNILVRSLAVKYGFLALSVITLIAAAIGIIKTKRS